MGTLITACNGAGGNVYPSIQLGGMCDQGEYTLRLTPLHYSQQAGGMHPTGILTCLIYNLYLLCLEIFHGTRIMCCRNLQHYCRCAVRRVLGVPRIRRIAELPLPTTLKEYLLLEFDELR